MIQRYNWTLFSAGNKFAAEALPSEIGEWIRYEDIEEILIAAQNVSTLYKGFRIEGMPIPVKNLIHAVRRKEHAS